MKIDKLIETIKSKIGNDCFEFALHIDCCRIRLSNERRKCLMLKIRFDKCADKYLGLNGGCDCIFVFPDKISLIECTTGKFRDTDAKRKPEQIKRCYEFIRSLNYNGLIEIVIYSNYFKKTAMCRFENELKDVKKKGAVIRFLRCGRDPIR